MKYIQDKDKVEIEYIKTYEQIDGLQVIEDLLLFKGVGIVDAKKTVSQKMLDDMALITYNLKVNQTNRLYVGMYLDKFYHRAGLICDSRRIKVPADIYDKVKEVNDRYKQHNEQSFI